jgi:hypothetical protein
MNADKWIFDIWSILFLCTALTISILFVIDLFSAENMYHSACERHNLNYEDRKVPSIFIDDVRVMCSGQVYSVHYMCTEFDKWGDCTKRELELGGRQ